MNRSNSEVLSKFVLPSGLATNSQELKHLHRKLLQNHYESASPENKYTRSKNAFNSQVALTNRTQELQKEIGLNQYDAQTRQSQKIMKAALSNDLIEQMKIKAIKQQRQKYQIKSQEYDLNKHINGLDALEKEKHQRFKDKYRLEAEQDLKLRQQKKVIDSMLSANQKQFYKNRYSVGNLAEGTQIPRNASYANPTKQVQYKLKQYYYQLDQALRERESKVRNPEAVQYNSSFKITRKADSLGHLDFMHQGDQYRSNYYHQSNYYQTIKQRQAREKQQLKNVLLSQIHQKETNKKAQKSQEFNHPYTRQDYLGMHHPIYNPVDFRHAHDNKYVLKELSTLK